LECSVIPDAAAVPPASPGVIDPTTSGHQGDYPGVVSRDAGFSQRRWTPANDAASRDGPQKAEAMARLGMQQQHFGLKDSESVFEGQRHGRDVARSGAQAKQAEAETAAIPQRTKVEQDA